MNAIAYAIIIIVIAFVSGGYCGTTKWFDTLMRDIGELLRSK